MSVHQLRASQVVRRPIDEVFAFFSRPENLGRITPPAMGFEQRSTDLDMRPGLEIEHRIRPLLGIPLRWRSRIESYEPPRSFVDVQTRGPYRSWRARHTFTDVPGGTRIDDEVTYELPLGPLGDLAHAVVVRGAAARDLPAPRPNHRVDLHDARSPSRADDRRRRRRHGLRWRRDRAGAPSSRPSGRRPIASRRGGERPAARLDRASARRRHRPATGCPRPSRGVDALAIALAFPNSPIEAPRRGRTFLNVDAGGTERLVAGAAFAGVRRLLYVSGAGAAPDAKRHWFRAKWRAESAIWQSGIPFTIIRPTWIYGPRDVSLNRFLGFARRLWMVPMTNTGRQLLAPVFVDDAARLAADSLDGRRGRVPGLRAGRARDAVDA